MLGQGLPVFGFGALLCGVEAGVWRGFAQCPGTFLLPAVIRALKEAPRHLTFLVSKRLLTCMALSVDSNLNLAVVGKNPRSLSLKPRIRD